MDTIQMKKRASALKLADAVNAIEGVPVSKYAKDLSARWAMGEITGEQMKTALILSHRQLAAQKAARHG